MGVVNVTPDSFSDGGKYNNPSAAIAHALQLVEDGADILDIGGESTRPGAASVDESEELSRVLPVVEGLQNVGVPLSIDTSKAAVMRAAIDAGASIVNDVLALRSEGALRVCAESTVGVCLMHMQGEPRTMQSAPQYHDVVSEVIGFLRERVAACEAAGIPRNRIAIDPGIGFGKTLEHNLALLRATPSFATECGALLLGVSRKSMFKAMFNLSPDQRVLPSVVTALLAAQNGATILRVHDVRETRIALQLWENMRTPPSNCVAD